MSNFEKAYAITMANEGGYNNSPTDPGGETYKGISRVYNPKWSGWAIIDQVKAIFKGKPTNQQMNIALKTRPDIQISVHRYFKANYWDTLWLDLVTDVQLTNNLFDCSVNPCIDTAAEVMQKACNEVARSHSKPLLTVDGRVGAKTITLIAELPAAEVHHAVNKIREDNYRLRITKTPKMKIWLANWLSRLKAYKQ